MLFFRREYLKALFCIWMVINYCDALPSKKYLAMRENLIQEEKSIAFGGKLHLTGDEVLANECLMAAKRKEVDEGFETPSKFLPARSFLSAREDIERSKVFKILRTMPKGALFHAHSSAIASVDFIVKNMTYEPNLYTCLNGNSMTFRFFQRPDNTCKWQLLKNVRQSDVSIDKKIKNSLRLIDGEYSDINAVWDKFEGTISVLQGLIKYRPLFERFFYTAMQELYDDNVMLMELRSSMSALYELDGSILDTVNVARVYKEVSDRFVKDHPGFLGAKVIYAPYRKVSQKTFDNYMATFRKMKAAYPDFFIGFDLVGQEDKGYPLLNFADKLQEFGKETSFFFHAGETNWYGHSTDENLYDAVLLNTKRIGHGFALLKHPKLMQIVKQKNIAIELNPISNQVLALVKDMRNHPASYFFAENFPVVVSNDDPNLWGVKGLSYDFYETFVGIMSRDADLRALKQLAINSIAYSGLDTNGKKIAFDIFNKAWQKFVRNLSKNCDAY